MGRKEYAKANEILAARKRQAEIAAEHRLDEVHEKIPEIKRIDVEFTKTEKKIVKAILSGSDGIKDKIALIEKEHDALTRKRKEVLKANGYPEDYTAPKYYCEKCKDTGYITDSHGFSKLCSCKKKELVLAGYENSGIGALMKTQSFDTFSLDYYGDKKESAERNLETARAYARNFSGTDNGNLLFVGNTGLGKTHLSTSIATVVIDRGFDVKYETAQKIFSDFENKQFHSGYGVTDTEEDITQCYSDCDLLIIDDLGTEIANQFVVSTLYSLINARISMGKAMIINTNLSSKEIRERYSDRIASRLFGEFSILLFEGKDIRNQKLKERMR